MFNYSSRTVRSMAIDARKVFVLGALLALALWVLLASEPAHRVEAGFAAVIEAKLTASDPTAGDRFGFSVSVDGDTAVVGA